MIADKQFRETMAQRRIIIEPASGEELDRIVDETTKLPAEVVKIIAEIVKG